MVNSMCISCNKLDNTYCNAGDYVTSLKFMWLLRDELRGRVRLCELMLVMVVWGVGCYS